MMQSRPASVAIALLIAAAVVAAFVLLASSLGPPPAPCENSRTRIVPGYRSIIPVTECLDPTPEVAN